MAYEIGDLVAIKRTQFGTGLKIARKYLGPYKVKKIGVNERYEVEKVGEHEGPITTTTSADQMKPWRHQRSYEEYVSSDEEEQIDEVQE